MDKAFIDQLVRFTHENIRTLVFRADLTLFGPYISAAVQIFSHMDLTVGQEEHITVWPDTTPQFYWSISSPSKAIFNLKSKPQLFKNLSASPLWLTNEAPINPFVLSYGQYWHPSFSYGPHFVPSALQSCGLNILRFGPHKWLIRA